MKVNSSSSSVEQILVSLLAEMEKIMVYGNKSVLQTGREDDGGATLLSSPLAAREIFPVIALRPHLTWH